MHRWGTRGDCAALLAQRMDGKTDGRKGHSGGARTGAGRKDPPRQIQISKEAARHLRRVWRARTLHEPGLTEDEIVNGAIMALAEPADEWDGSVL